MGVCLVMESKATQKSIVTLNVTPAEFYVVHLVVTVTESRNKMS